ncbi:hypothetical protein O181_020341 [Austropuccinia psidii MF-1]|uniref:Uncharacterized protein n=1 Tax=Austropuccinia psidii MF-1 TaxID=1389203 RepID=A0A9Q3GUR0_9BASI|nr:hypothetical protein [Austropuccinia psidii MF-1]
MDTKSSNHEDNNPVNDSDHKNPEASHNNPIPEPMPFKAEPCGTFPPQQDPIFNWDSKENLSAPKGGTNKKKKLENFQKPLGSDPEDNQGTHNSERKDEYKIPPSHEYERGSFPSQSID